MVIKTWFLLVVAVDWTLSVLFDAMGAMSSKYNETRGLASRPYDINRDGFVIAGGEVCLFRGA